jgi:peptidyl-prolyl cis-trans isomerase B (cyclophilin B)
MLFGLFLCVYALVQCTSADQIHASHHNNVRSASNTPIYHDEALPDKFFVTHEAWFNISISENKFAPSTKSERIVIGLFGEICPMTVTNFVTITKGLRRSSVIILQSFLFVSSRFAFDRSYRLQTRYTYKGSPVHRIVRDFVIQTGDFTNGDGTGGEYAHLFDERD